MRHYAARERTGRADGTSGRWDYTVRHDDAIHRVGYCFEAFERAWPERPGVVELTVYGDGDAYQAARAKALEHATKYHADGHATAAEACACYRDFILDNELRFVADAAEGEAESLYRCQAPAGCQAYTSGGATWGSGGLVHLCATHRTRDVVQTMIAHVAERWES